MFETSVVKEKEIKGLVEKNIHSTKGDAGRVLIIGGSEKYVGSAVLAGLAALRSGVDSVVIAAPELGARLMNAFSPDFITVKLKGPNLYDDHIGELARMSEKADVVLLGPGLGVSPEIEKWVEQLIPKLRAPIVLDADATKQVKLASLNRSILLANKKEYALFKQHNSAAGNATFDLADNVLVIKGREDMIMITGSDRVVQGGHSRATVAGTGDVLSGIAAALYAQTKEPLQAAMAASFIAKRAAERLADKHHFGFLASDMIDMLPQIMKELRVFRVTKYEKK